jgi:putative lipoic acid-binding regulatory protein
MGSLTMSMFNQAEILHLQGTVSDIAAWQNHIVDVLQKHEIDIHKLNMTLSASKKGSYPCPILYLGIMQSLLSTTQKMKSPWK